MRRLFPFSCVLALATAGVRKTWCARVKEGGGTPSAECESTLTNLCIQSTPVGRTEPADVSACISAANTESCNQVLAALLPSCTLRCK